MGRWIDFKNDYKSMYPWFMESIWWVFKQIYDKGLIYQGFRVMPYSTGCSTPLSNFEVAQNYKVRKRKQRRQIIIFLGFVFNLFIDWYRIYLCTVKWGNIVVGINIVTPPTESLGGYTLFTFT